MIIAAVEAGGTKFVWGVFEADRGSDSAPKLLARGSLPTTDPGPTLEATGVALAEACASAGGPDYVGVGCFGPADLRRSSPGWGRIAATPKLSWRGADVAGYFREALGAPVAFDTDVNAAAYGEYLWGAARGLEDFVYITVGTGIGGGVFSGGSLVHGLAHPELGHVKLAREGGDGFAGLCPYHRDCLEGMASGPAIRERWGRAPEELPPEHPAWELEARYLARAAAACACVLSPERVILGGGIGMRPGIVERVAALLGEELAGYLADLDDPRRLASFVTRPGLGHDAGLFGSAALALRLQGD